MYPITILQKVNLFNTLIKFRFSNEFSKKHFYRSYHSTNIGEIDLKFNANYTYPKPRDTRKYYLNTFVKFIVFFSIIFSILFVLSELLFIDEAPLELSFAGVAVYRQSANNIPVYTAYVGLIIGFLIGVGMFSGAMLANKILAPPGGRLRTNVIDDDEFAETTYECGETPIGEGHAQINLQYYSFAIVFIMFDVISALALMFALVFSFGFSGGSEQITILNGILWTPSIIDILLQVLGIIFFITLPLIVLGFWLKKKAILWQ